MNDLTDELARQLTGSIAAQGETDHGFTSLSSAVYDTAWVAMVEKEVDGKTSFLFPKCFDYLEETQLPDGSWASELSLVDGIINSLAALLALKRRSHKNGGQEYSRCRKGEIALRNMLNQWDIEQTDRVGFEVLVPKLLTLLEKEGVHLEFPGKQSLMQLSDQKLAKIRPILDGPVQTTLMHSLEALVGDFDFDKVKHHKTPEGSMLGSPSSTAAYLMNSNPWDSDAEQYLQRVMKVRGVENHFEGLPSAFPTTIFETAWVTSTLIASGFTRESFVEGDLAKITHLLKSNLEKDGGVVGFAPSFLPDADDTARTILSLTMLGEQPDIEPMLAEFEAKTWFRTFHLERNPSISANCNILLCLLRSSDRSKYTSQISKAATYISKSWLAGSVEDKWNISYQYPMMLIAQAFSQLLCFWEKNELNVDAVPELLVRQHVPIILLQILARTVEVQKPDGSWDSMHEVTAYAVLTLKAFLDLPWLASVKIEGIACMERGRAYLHRNQDRWAQGDHLWIEKVVYASSNLSQAYCLAATKVAIPPLHHDEVTNRTWLQSEGMIAKFNQFFSRIPLFTKTPYWELDLWLLQSLQFVPSLKNSGNDIFPPMKISDKEKYLNYIPFTWIGCNEKHGSGASIDSLWEMMIISMLNFQADAYMETVFETGTQGKFEALKAVVTKLFKEPKQATTNGIDNGHTESLETGEAVLSKFIAHVLQHEKVLQSHPKLQSWLRYELKTFLLAHITQMEDCAALSENASYKPSTTYHNWARNTGANHTSCPYSFVFYLCLISKPQQDLTGVRKYYLLEDACRHLATMCRQYNDFGSVARDRQEKNLNSIDFPEFETQGEGDVESVDTRNKADLLYIAEYERRCLDSALSELEKCLDLDLLSKIKLFVHVTDLYGQIYVARDIGVRKIANGVGGK